MRHFLSQFTGPQTQQTPKSAPLPRITVGSVVAEYPQRVLPEGENPHLHLLISIGDPRQVLPPWLKHAPADSILRLEFGDFGADDYTGHDCAEDAGMIPMMQPPQMQTLLSRIRLLEPPQDGPLRLHVHCSAGVSRSTAVAAVALVTLRPEVSDEAALRHIQSVRPAMRPNTRVLALADEALNRKLLRTWQRMEGL